MFMYFNNMQFRGNYYSPEIRMQAAGRSGVDNGRFESVAFVTATVRVVGGEDWWRP